jgi:hypothetical protein
MARKHPDGFSETAIKLKWTFTDTNEVWDNMIWVNSYASMGSSLFIGIIFRFTEDAANSSTDFGMRIYTLVQNNV